HLGHAFAALTAFDVAMSARGRFLLRIEDIDRARAKQEFEDAIKTDLAWLDIRWEEPVRRQSEHFADYEEALRKLEAKGLLYPCFCTRKEIADEFARAASAPHGPEGPLYPGLCRALSPTERARRIREGAPYALRLDMEKARALHSTLVFMEHGQ